MYFSNKKNLINPELILVCALSLIAIFVSTSVVFFTNAGNEIRKMLLSYIEECTGDSLLTIFLLILSEHMVFLIICFVSGMSYYGKIPVLYITLLKITGISAVAAATIKAYLLKGLEYCLLVFAPGKITLIFAVVFTSVNCLKSCNDIRRLYKNNESADFIREAYAKHHLLSGVLLIFSALIDSITLKLFLPLFNFS